MAVCTELVLRLPNSPGALGRVCRLLGDERIGIQAMSLDTGGTLRLVSDNPLKAAGVLQAEQYAVRQRDVLVVSLSRAPGALSATARMLADAGVNVEYAYGSQGDSLTAAQGPAAVVLGVEDAPRAAAETGL